MVGLVLGYLGTNYKGLSESDPLLSTVAGAVRKAVADAGLVSADNAASLDKIGWSQSSRTDKGVHAVGLVAGVKLLFPTERPPAPSPPASGAGPHDMVGSAVARINRHLPADIAVLGGLRVPQHFDARMSCRIRSYCYMVPTTLGPPGREADLRDGLRALVGVHSVHNLTSPAKATDSKVRRSRERPLPSFSLPPDLAAAADTGAVEMHPYFNHAQLVREVLAADLTPAQVDGREYYAVRFRGTSFVYHQIRKMVGLLAAAWVTGDSLETYVRLAVSPFRVNIPLAPPGCLFLENLDSADLFRRPRRANEFSAVEFDEAVRGAIRDFRDRHVLPEVNRYCTSPGGVEAFAKFAEELDYWRATVTGDRLRALVHLSGEYHRTVVVPRLERREGLLHSKRSSRPAAYASDDDGDPWSVDPEAADESGVVVGERTTSTSPTF